MCRSSAQVFGTSGIFQGVEPRDTRALGNLVSLERVRCLECGSSYTKPVDGGTVNENPGCPKCGYLGWITTTIPPRPDGEPRRFDEDRPQHRAAQQR